MKEHTKKLVRAQREGESLSDVIIRLTSTKVAGLQKRGEKEIVTSDGRKLIVRIDQNLCLAAESCVTMAPMVFALDETNLGFTRREAEPLGMMDVPLVPSTARRSFWQPSHVPTAPLL